MSTEIVLDLETTGLDPKQGHRIVEIGAIKLINKLPSKNKADIFHHYVNPQRDMPSEAYNIHGISSNFLKNKPLFSELADSLLEFIEGGTLIIHNASFDVKFLNYELAMLGKGTINVTRVIDTLRMAQNLYPGKRASLDALCDRFKIDLSDRKLHGALKDSELLAKVYYLMSGGVSQYSLKVEQNIQEMKNLKEHRNQITSKVVKPTQDELDEHLKLIRKMQSSIWATVSEEK
jgi:DNA polymerase-3 subunit epsilon